MASTKKLNTEIFIERASKIHNSIYDYSKVEYINGRSKVIIICPIHGEFPQPARNHLIGCGCDKCGIDRSNKSHLKTTEQFIGEVKGIHSNFYTYDNVIYLRCDEEVIITCPLHGDFPQMPKSHLEGKGCDKCGRDRIEKSKFKTTEEFIKDATRIHKGKYSYSKVNYIDGKKEVIVTCNTHGDFKREASRHLEGKGCKQCAYLGHGGYSKTDYIKKAKERICTFYTLRCFNENEEFYKIGITMNSVKKRYSTVESMPYNYEIVSEVFGEAGFIWDLELQEKRKLKEFHYNPKIDFKGSITECFIRYEGK